MGLALLAFIILWLIPWIIVHISPPPKGYVLILGPGKEKKGPLSVYTAGMSHRRRKVTIGGNPKKAHIHVNSLKPVEFYVAQVGNEIKIFDAAKDTPRETFRTNPSSDITTSTDVKLRVGLDNTKLK